MWLRQFICKSEVVISYCVQLWIGGFSPAKVFQNVSKLNLGLFSHPQLGYEAPSPASQHQASVKNRDTVRGICQTAQRPFNTSGLFSTSTTSGSTSKFSCLKVDLPPFQHMHTQGEGKGNGSLSLCWKSGIIPKFPVIFLIFSLQLLTFPKLLIILAQFIIIKLLVRLESPGQCCSLTTGKAHSHPPGTQVHPGRKHWGEPDWLI